MKAVLIILLIISNIFISFGQKYKNFRVSVYCTVFDVNQMSDTLALQSKWNDIARQLKIDKVYLETHRDMFVIDQAKLDAVKTFFRKRGIEIAGGITFTVKEANHFSSYCYSDPDNRKKAIEISEFTAKNFNEFILDDFFFTNCKNDGAIKDKGNRSWTQYRLDLMTEAAQNLVVGPAKKINPKVKIVIKYPNWYEHFQGLGFNLEKEPKIFDGIYTGTETRDAVLSDQHLQPYLGYNIIRYFNNIAPGRNGGGWVDPFGISNYDRYAEQLWITAFAKAPEITLFHFGQLSRPLDYTLRAPWQGQKTSFDFEELMKPVNRSGGAPLLPTTLARVAGYTFEIADSAIGKIGNPIGIKSYRPYHSLGDDFLQNYLGMIGLPMDESPDFPASDNIILLTEEAKFDANIITKIKGQLTAGKKVVITSGLLKALQDKGLNDIVELRYTDRKALVQDYTVDGQLEHSDKQILIPQIQYLTNDSWEVISGIAGPNGWPLLHMADYSNGKLYVLTIPDNVADLYNLPPKVLNKLREVLCGDLNLYFEGPSNVAIYQYDNQTFIAESFLDKETTIKVIAPGKFSKLTDLKTNQAFPGESRQLRNFMSRSSQPAKNTFDVILKPHSFRVFKYE